MVEVLTQCGVRIKTSVDSLKQTPLYYAVREGHDRVIDALVDGGLNVNHLDIYGQNPIYYAISSGNVQITRLLVNKGADPDVVDLNG
jgi:ankyrin repeat protein